MSFDYISDIYGKFRKNKVTRFSEVEAKAISLIKSLVFGKIDNKSFAEQFIEVREEYVKLSTINGQRVIDQDTPLWIGRFYGFKFMQWYKVQQYKWHFEEEVVHHPERITDDIDEIRRTIHNFEKQFLEVCMDILSELER